MYPYENTPCKLLMFEAKKPFSIPCKKTDVKFETNGLKRSEGLWQAVQKVALFSRGK
jgi:hypothetical protein